MLVWVIIFCNFFIYNCFFLFILLKNRFGDIFFLSEIFIFCVLGSFFNDFSLK